MAQMSARTQFLSRLRGSSETVRPYLITPDDPRGPDAGRQAIGRL